MSGRLHPSRVLFALPLVAIAMMVGLAGGPATGAATTPTTAATAAEHDHHPHRDHDIVYGPAPDAFPPGAQMAVLQGDPSVAGQIFTVRLRLPNGYVLPPHRHPTDEHVTVIRGTFLVGLGDDFDRHAFLAPFRRGDFVTAPADVSHFAQAKGTTEVQVHAIGPFEMTYVHPEDDPRNHR